MGCAEIAAIGLHLASAHSVDTYNNVNPGVYVVAECGATAGVFYNSQRRVSVYAGWTLESGPFWASAALATGYGWEGEKARALTPIGMIGLRRDIGPASRMRVGYIPKLGRWNDSHVVHLMIEIKL